MASRLPPGSGTLTLSLFVPPQRLVTLEHIPVALGLDQCLSFKLAMFGLLLYGSLFHVHCHLLKSLPLGLVPVLAPVLVTGAPSTTKPGMAVSQGLGFLSGMYHRI